MSASSAYLHQFDEAWDHKWESLTSALDGVGNAESCWQAACYEPEPPEEGWPPPGTIRWQVAHIAHCKRHYAALIRSRGQEDAPLPAPRPATASLAEDRAELEAAHADERAAMAEVADHDLELRVGNGMPLREFFAMAIRHDTWHASQIAVARRLWRCRPRGSEA